MILLAPEVYFVTLHMRWYKGCFSKASTKTESIQDDFLHENIPTPERSQESDSVSKGIKMSCS